MCRVTFLFRSLNVLLKQLTFFPWKMPKLNTNFFHRLGHIFEYENSVDKTHQLEAV